VTLREAYLWNEDGTELLDSVNEEYFEKVMLGQWNSRWKGSIDLDPDGQHGSDGEFFILRQQPSPESLVEGAYTEWTFVDNQGRQFKCTLNGTLGTCVEN